MPESPKKSAVWAAALILAGFGAGFFLQNASGGGLTAAVSSSLDDFFGGSAAETMEIATDTPAAFADPPPSPGETFAPPVPRPKSAPAKKSAPRAASSTAAALPAATSSPPTWCAWKTPGVPRGPVRLNEVAWMGAEDDAEAEWIELKNISGGEISLDGWRLQSKDGKTRAVLGGLLPAGGFYLVGRAPAEADWQVDRNAELGLSNSGEWLKLFNSWCGAADELNAARGWPGGSNSSKKTLEKKVAAEAWQTSAEPGGSPGKQNTVILETAPPRSGGSGAAEPAPPGNSAPARILIVEVQTSGGAGKSDNDFIKLWNAGVAAADLSGWKLRRRSKSGTEYSVKTFADGAEIPAGGFYLWANSKFPEGADATSTATLSDDNSAALFAADDVLQDAVAWGSDLINPYAEGAYPANPLPGQILARKSAGGIYEDTQVNAADFEIK